VELWSPQDSMEECKVHIFIYFTILTSIYRLYTRQQQGMWWTMIVEAAGAAAGAQGCVSVEPC
jgi:hypothetical protein